MEATVSSRITHLEGYSTGVSTQAPTERTSKVGAKRKIAAIIEELDEVTSDLKTTNDNVADLQDRTDAHGEVLDRHEEVLDDHRDRLNMEAARVADCEKEVVRLTNELGAKVDRTELAEVLSFIRGKFGPMHSAMFTCMHADTTCMYRWRPQYTTSRRSHFW